MLAVYRSVLRLESREEVAVFDSVNLRNRTTRRTHDLPMLDANPHEPVEKALPVKDLARPQLQDIAIGPVDDFDSLVADLVEADRFGRKHERVHIAEVAKVFVRQSQALQLEDRSAAVTLDTFPCASEGDVANLFVASHPHAVLDLPELECLRVGVVVALGNKPAA